jgi:hypothetical protein
VANKTDAIMEFNDEALAIFYREEASKLADKIDQLVSGFPGWQGIGALSMTMGRIMAQFNDDDDDIEEMLAFIQHAIIEEIEEITNQRKTEETIPAQIEVTDGANVLAHQADKHEKKMIEDHLPENECALVSTNNMTNIILLTPDSDEIEVTPSVLKFVMACGLRFHNDRQFVEQQIAWFDNQVKSIQGRATVN